MSEVQPITSFSTIRGIAVEVARQEFPHRTRGLLGVIRDGNKCFVDIARVVRQFTPDEQVRFISRTLGPEGANFHNSDTLAQFLVRIGNTHLPEQPPTLQEIQIIVPGSKVALVDNNHILAAISENFQVISHNAYQRSFKNAEYYVQARTSNRSGEAYFVNSVLGAILLDSMPKGMSLLNSPSLPLRRSIALAGRLILLQDLMEDTIDTREIHGLADPVIDLWEMGVHVIGQRRTGFLWSKKEFTVFVPGVTSPQE